MTTYEEKVSIKMRLSGGESQPSIYKTTGISVSTLSKVVAGERWASIPWPDGSTGRMPTRYRVKITEARSNSASSPTNPTLREWNPANGTFTTHYGRVVPIRCPHLSPEDNDTIHDIMMDLTITLAQAIEKMPSYREETADMLRRLEEKKQQEYEKDLAERQEKQRIREEWIALDPDDGIDDTWQKQSAAMQELCKGNNVPIKSMPHKPGEPHHHMLIWPVILALTDIYPNGLELAHKQLMEIAPHLEKEFIEFFNTDTWVDPPPPHVLDKIAKKVEE
jgi:hypothetical protein